jgi:hypothetical protein
MPRLLSTSKVAVLRVPDKKMRHNWGERLSAVVLLNWTHAFHEDHDPPIQEWIREGTQARR